MYVEPELDREVCDICCGTKEVNGEKCLCEDGTLFGMVYGLRSELRKIPIMIIIKLMKIFLKDKLSQPI